MLGRAYWDLDVPKSYVLLTENLAMTLSNQRKILRNVGDESYSFKSLDAGYEAFLSLTMEVTNFLESVA